MRLIDADALVKQINEARCADCDEASSHGCWACQWNDAIAMVKGAPTVCGWISVEDRLPVRPPDVCGLLVRRQWYLVALESGAVLTLSYEFDEDRWQGVGSPVTHWMPLPEPPGGKRVHT